MAKTILIVQCYCCGKYLAARAAQKTRGCPHCGERLLMARVKVSGQAKGGEEARRIILTLNAREGRGSGSRPAMSL